MFPPVDNGEAGRGRIVGSAEGSVMLRGGRRSRSIGRVRPGSSEAFAAADPGPASAEASTT
jgi:hypothetical protein